MMNFGMTVTGVTGRHVDVTRYGRKRVMKCNDWGDIYYYVIYSPLHMARGSGHALFFSGV